MVDEKAARLPAHIAIIMDGNGRWAKGKGLPRAVGHKAGVEALREIIRTGSDMGIKCLTVYAFSTENWKRPDEEVNALFTLLSIYIDKEINEIHRNNVKLTMIGDYSKIPEKVLIKVNKALKMTQDNTGMIFNIALNYGARDEIVNMAKNMFDLIVNNEIKKENIDYELINSLLYTKDLPDPDLVIRTSGEMRLSNFLLIQSAYSELFFTDKFWPDFRKEDLIEAIKSYQQRKRRYGAIESEGTDEN